MRTYTRNIREKNQENKRGGWDLFQGYGRVHYNTLVVEYSKLKWDKTLFTMQGWWVSPLNHRGGGARKASHGSYHRPNYLSIYPEGCWGIPLRTRGVLGVFHCQKIGVSSFISQRAKSVSFVCTLSREHYGYIIGALRVHFGCNLSPLLSGILSNLFLCLYTYVSWRGGEEQAYSNLCVHIYIIVYLY